MSDFDMGLPAVSSDPTGGWGGAIGSAGNLLGSIFGNATGAAGANQNAGMIKNIGAESTYMPQYAQQLSQLMSNPSSITSTPGFEFGMNQAESQVQHSLASQGLIGGGTMAGTMANTGAAYAGQQLQQQEGMLAQLAGAQFNPADLLAPQQQNTQSKANSGSSLIGDVASVAGVAAMFGF